MVDVGVSGEATKTTLGVFAQPQVTQFAGKDWSCGNATLGLYPSTAGQRRCIASKDSHD